MAAVDPIPKPRPCHRRVSDDHSRFHAPERPLIRKNVPNTKQSTTVIARLFFPIHAHKDPSIAEARAILEPLADDAGIFPERLERQERKLRARMPHEGQLDGEITGRELDVLRLLTSELSNRQIAQRRYVVAGMLRTHVKSIQRKLGVSSREQAVEEAHARGLIQPSHNAEISPRGVAPVGEDLRLCWEYSLSGMERSEAKAAPEH